MRLSVVLAAYFLSSSVTSFVITRSRDRSAPVTEHDCEDCENDMNPETTLDFGKSEEEQDESVDQPNYIQEESEEVFEDAEEDGQKEQREKKQELDINQEPDKEETKELEMNLKQEMKIGQNQEHEFKEEQKQELEIERKQEQIQEQEMEAAILDLISVNHEDELSKTLPVETSGSGSRQEAGKDDSTYTDKLCLDDGDDILCKLDIGENVMEMDVVAPTSLEPYDEALLEAQLVGADSAGPPHTPWALVALGLGGGATLLLLLVGALGVGLWARNRARDRAGARLEHCHKDRKLSMI